MTETVLRLLPLVVLLILPPLLAYRGVGRSRLNYLGLAILAGVPGAVLCTALRNITDQAYVALAIVALGLLALATGSLAAICFWRPRATVQRN